VSDYIYMSVTAASVERGPGIVVMAMRQTFAKSEDEGHS
jgi:hypothetical protein